VRPTGKGTWAFAGFSRYDEVLKGGIGVSKAAGASTVLSELVDSETAEKMMAHLNEALAASVRDLLPEGTKVRFVLREEERPIAGGSDARSEGSEVDLRDGPQTPRRSSRAGGAGSLLVDRAGGLVARGVIGYGGRGEAGR